MKLPVKLRDTLNQARQTYSGFWAARDARERTMLTAAVAVALLGLTYTLLIDPALSGRDRLNKNLPELRQQVAQLQALAQEAAAYAGKTAAPMAPVSAESIKAALAAKGLNPQNVTLAGDLVKVQLADASFAGMLNWIDEMQKTARLSVTDANIVVLEKPDTVNAALTLRQPKKE